MSINSTVLEAAIMEPSKENLRRANVNELRRVLQMSYTALLSALKVGSGNVSIRADKDTPRLRVSVTPEDVSKIPTSMVWKLDGEDLVLRLEAAGDFKQYRAYAGR